MALNGAIKERGLNELILANTRVVHDERLVHMEQTSMLLSRATGDILELTHMEQEEE